MTALIWPPDITVTGPGTLSVLTVMVTTLPALLVLRVNADKETSVTPPAPPLVKSEILTRKIIAMQDLLTSLENKVISVMPMPVVFTNVSEMLSAPRKPRPNPNTSLALPALNADAETPTWSAPLLSQ